jgi:hypothetical protein
MNDAPPQIPADEYPKRWRSVQQLMEEENLDLVVAYADDRAVFGPAHARWLANFPVHFESVCIVLARTGPPALLCGPESDQYALLAGRIPDVHICASSPIPMKTILIPISGAWPKSLRCWSARPARCGGWASPAVV